MFMKRISFLLFAGLLALSVTTRGEEIAEPAANTEMQQETQGGVDFDPGAVIIGHVTDAQMDIWIFSCHPASITDMPTTKDIGLWEAEWRPRR